MTKASPDISEAFQRFAINHGLKKPGPRQIAMLMTRLLLTSRIETNHDEWMRQIRQIYQDARMPNSRLLERILAHIRAERAQSLGRIRPPRPISDRAREITDGVLGRARLIASTSRRH